MVTSISGLQNNMITNLSSVGTQLSGISTCLKGVFGDNKMPSDYFIDPDPSYNKRTEKIALTGNKLAMLGNRLSAAAITQAAANDLAIVISNLPFGAGVVPSTLAIALSSSMALGAIADVMINNNYLASGGFPSMGQMFIAREAGPELVGTIGGRNAVVNNNQIVESVSAGVYQAVKSALKGGSESVIQVFIGNEQLDEYIVSSKQRRMLQTNGVYA